ncbi:4-hydroxy-3-methylbut-2-en-1-yl diphosphate synthase [Porphyromonas macacae]|uniref:4-hydroxy-3-methylbut-2-en-1-yl diphosphate synthase (flavodoxin) n=1 Tax=Porphyromonas macacae TaxID=28115 RepID=A0A379EAZ5_9PORP|nr:(E)-4-hydroxy-3-methylbut-2-enyl-diphosphate synthase [Porphyromonas macacae]SUB89610.1 4-hydroxy-3-methylbut-2-en-1-yl diphosphate synthase [Porphyromonas macacae]
MTESSIYSPCPCKYVRRPSVEVRIGTARVGGKHPIAIQSMASVSTMDTNACIEQAQRIIDAGASIVRYTAQGVKEANNLGYIRAGLNKGGYTQPLVADIHFNPKAADTALEQVEKVRINPGNYVDTKGHKGEWTDEDFDKTHRLVEERFGAFVERAKALGRAVRIGVNHGSLSERMVQRYGDTPEGMVESCLEYLDVCIAHRFYNIVISMKSSNTMVMTQVVRLLDKRLREGCYPAFPLHLGVTEAGEGEDGRIKSAVGIGSLLADGLGDTIRVSLSEDPECEVPVGFALRDYIVQRAEALIEADDLPDWQEYDSYRIEGRRQTFCVRNVIGGSVAPCVISGREDAELADFLYSDGKLHAVGKAITIDTVELDAVAWDEDLAGKARNNPETVIMLWSHGVNTVGEWRLGYVRLMRRGIKNPVVLCRDYRTDIERYRLFAAADAGSILLDGWANGLMLRNSDVSAKDEVATQLAVLQASRLRMSKTEYISCPGCGRTLYDLQSTIAQIKAATSHLKGLKIGIMGCIVNGPGEMADADYGYVGGSPGKIDLYKQQECVRKGIPQEEAVEELIALIKSNNDWQEPENK